MTNLRFGSKIIDQDEFNFSLDGKIEPRFVVTGTGSVRIEDVELQPQDSFIAGAVGGVMHGSIKIEFINDSADNRVTCFYCEEIPLNENC